MRRTAVFAAFVVFAVTSLFARDLPSIDALAGKRIDPSAQTAVAARGRNLIKAGTTLSVESRLGLPTMVWAPDGLTATPAGTKGSGGSASEMNARAFLAQYASLYRHESRDAADASLLWVHDTGTGPIIAKFQQKIEGIEIFREEINVMMNRRNELVAIGGYISSTRTPAAKSGEMSFKLDAKNAATNAYQNLTQLPLDASQLTPAGSRAGYDYYNMPASAQQEEPVRMKKVYFHVPEGLIPAYYVEIAVRDEVASVEGGQYTLDYYAYVVSATDGSVLFRKNLTVNDAVKAESVQADATPGALKPKTDVSNPYTYRVWADLAGIPFDTPAGNAVHPKVTATPDGFQATFVSTNDVTLSNYPFSMNDPWLDVGATETIGNNVEAYVDLAAADGLTGSDFRATVTAPGTFLHVTVPDGTVTTNEARQGAIQQLFFNDNFLHDWYYDAGFNEVARNAQQSNYARGGVELDRIKAEAQDYSGRNNANMSTPADGARPRMQMFVFDTGAPKFFDVNSPAAAAGRRSIGTGQFGAQTFDLTGDVLQPSPATGCLVANYAGLAGKIALVNYEPTSACSIGTRLNAAMSAGVSAFVLVYLSTSPDTVVNVTGSLPTFTIPFASISFNGAAAIKAQLAVPNVVNARLYREAGPERDGDLDNQIVFHEWGHYLSNRLIGNGWGLASNQSGGMGEGWGDFNAMMLTVREDDTATPSNATWNGAYALATYATSGGANGGFNQGYYYGIRRAPYSTDMTINPLTYKHIANGQAISGAPIAFGASGATNSEVHNTGEVWAQMLWECYASLLRDTQGGSPRLTFAQAQTRMKQYLVGSLAMTAPVSPTLIEARDAVLAAAYATDPVDYVLFWQAFAKRGIGVGATAVANRDSLDNVGITESFVATPELVFDHATLDDSVSTCDADGALDLSEYGHLTVYLRNTGTTTLTGVTGTVSPSTSGFSVSGTLAFPSIAPLSTVSATVNVGADFSLVGRTQADFAIQYTHPSLASIPRNASASFATNYDVLPGTTATDTVEAPTTLWTTSFGPIPHNLSFGPFTRKAVTGLQHVWHADDLSAAGDERLTSPVFTVDGSGSANIQFDHSYVFEADGGGNYDGGVLEMSVNGGAFTSIGGTGTNPYTGTLLTYSGNTNPLQGQQAWTGASAGTVHSSMTQAIAPGSTVQYRFRAVSDPGVGRAGWDIDNIAFTGVVETPFATVVAEASACAPTIVAGGPTTFCAGGSVTLSSNNSTGNQWYLNGNPIGGATNQTLVVTASGSYTDTVNGGSPSNAIVVTVTPTPSTPTITPGGPTTFCTGGSVTLTSNSASGNQWYLNGNPIGGETNQNYVATAAGSYTVVVTTTGCSSAPSAATVVTVNPIPSTPTITPGGPTTFCTGGSVTLNSSSASGNQWYLNGNPIGGATNQAYVANASGNYTVVVTTSGCPSAASAATSVTVTPTPSTPTITPGGPTTFCTGGSVTLNSSSASGNQWYLNGNPIGGATNQAYVANASGSYTVVVTTTGCPSAPSSATVVTVNTNPDATVTAPGSVVTGSTGNVASVPSAGGGATYTWGITNGTITAGAGTNSITFTAGSAGSTGLTVIVTNSSPCSANGSASVTVTAAGMNFDANGDHTVDPSDIFYLIAYLFTGGPAPAGSAGPTPSGDANGDGVVDPADIFYVVNYLFGGGPAPHITRPGGPVTLSLGEPISGSLSLGKAARRDGRWFVPVIVTMDAGSGMPQAFSLRVRTGTGADAVMHRAAGLEPIFEDSRRTDDSVSYLVAFGSRAPLSFGSSRSAVIAEIELNAGSRRLEIDPALTMLVGADGTHKATVANHGLRVFGTTIGQNDRSPRTQQQDQ